MASQEFQLFEVFNLGHHSLNEVTSLSLPEIRAKYSIISNVESTDQLKPGVALAIVSPPSK
jgi:hypothetical protein